jgi:hypothetical protein
MYTSPYKQQIQETDDKYCTEPKKNAKFPLIDGRMHVRLTALFY